MVKGKVKLSLTTRWRRIEGSGRISTFILTSNLDGGEWSASRPGRLNPWERTSVPILQDTGWVPEPLWSFWRGEQSLASASVGTYTAGHWLGSGASLILSARGTISCLCQCQYLYCRTLVGFRSLSHPFGEGNNLVPLPVSEYCWLVMKLIFLAGTADWCRTYEVR